MKFFIVQFSQFSCYFLPLKNKPFSNFFSLHIYFHITKLHTCNKKSNVKFQASTTKYKRTAPFLVITQQVVVIFPNTVGQPIGPILTPEDGIDRLSQNVNKKLPLLAV